MDCTPQAVFDVLSDGWTYATWVVGASRIRDVEHGFPAAGSKIHHSVGFWPVLIDDNTEVEQVEPPRELQLRVRAWPSGEARVTLRCDPRGEHQTEVTMDEQAVSGPATLLPKPIQDVMLKARNVETLKRLAFLAESGARSKHGRYQE
jgi:uncharacterized protein YndB with AHSA1/START domain